MQTFKNFLLWLALAFACFLPAAALPLTEQENRIWEIFSIGYDAPTTEATDRESRTETSTSNYDTAPIHRAATEKIPTEANRALSGQNGEFKAAEEESAAGSQMNPVQQAQGKPVMTQWGWQNTPAWRDAANTLDSAGNNTTILDINGTVPTEEEATAMIEAKGGTVVRVDPAHPEGGVSTHTYPHINYTTSSGNRATVQIQGP